MAHHIENILSAVEVLKSNRFRTFLTLLGIIIGVAAVIMVGAAVRSGQSIIFEELETFGLKSLWVYRSFYDDQPGKTISPGTGLDNDDVTAILKNARLIKKLTPVLSNWNLWAKYDNNYVKIKLLAVGQDYALINNDSMARGRFLMAEDIEFRRSVCVIGVKVLDKLFGKNNPLGHEIIVENNKYTVVGIVEEKNRDFLSSIGSTGGEDANNRLIIPISTYQNQYNNKSIDHIQAEAIDIFSAKAAAEEIKTILHHRYKGRYNYDSYTMQQYIETTNKILQGVAWIGAIAAIVSLVVGGIGIMNIMTVSVVERIKEIGLRKALGARKIDVMIQFLSESIFISLIGGIIGTGVGISLILVIQVFSNKPRLLALKYIIVAIIVSLLTGIFSGLYPAHRASLLDPAEALRYD
ncbi:MAG: ABC transporter permease [bacterium]